MASDLVGAQWEGFVAVHGVEELKIRREKREKREETDNDSCETRSSKRAATTCNIPALP